MGQSRCGEYRFVSIGREGCLFPEHWCVWLSLEVASMLMSCCNRSAAVVPVKGNAADSLKLPVT